MRPFGPDRPPEQCETLIGGTCFARWEQGGRQASKPPGTGLLPLDFGIFGNESSSSARNPSASTASGVPTRS